MFTLEIPHNPTYRLTGTLTELLQALADELIASNRPTDGYLPWLEAVYPTDPSELDEDETAPAPVEITEDSVLTFAEKVWDTHALQLIEDTQPLTAGEFQAMQHHLGLSNAEMARRLRVDGRRLSRWIAGTHPIPAGVTREVEALLDHHDQDVQAVLEESDRGVPIIYPGDTSEQVTDAAFGWERRVVQRAAIEHGVRVVHAREA